MGNAKNADKTKNTFFIINKLLGSYVIVDSYGKVTDYLDMVKALLIKSC